MIFLRHTLAILGKDLLAEWHTRERLSTMVFFVLLILLVFNFSFTLGGAALHEIGPGVLWSAFVFASLFGLQRSFAAERENGCLDGLLLAPVSRSALYAGKALGNLVFLLAVELLSLPIFGLFFNLDPGWYLLPLVGVFFMGALALAAVGTLFGAMCSNQRLREMLLPLLLVPLVIPALILCIEATALILQQMSAAHWSPFVRLLAVYDVVFLTLALLLFEFVVEE